MAIWRSARICWRWAISSRAGSRYEWRNQTEAGKGTLPKMTSATWNGMRIPNGRLLMVGDQGYGDTIQFARYIPLIADRCQELILGCSAEMAPLLAKIPGVKQYLHRWTDVPGHAAHCRLSSVPHLVHTTLDTIPANVPYLHADPARITAWREKLDAKLPRAVRRIGLAWSGRPTHPNDRRRSIPLARLAPLAAPGHASFVSLQKPMPPADLPAVAQLPGLVDLSAELVDFGETAALIANLDLVITVDTAMAPSGRRDGQSRCGSCCRRRATGAGCWIAATALGIRPPGCSARSHLAPGIR